MSPSDVKIKTSFILPSRFNFWRAVLYPKQNVSTFEIFGLTISLGSSGTLTCKFLLNFRLFIFFNIQGGPQKLFGHNQIDTSSTNHTQQQKYQFSYGKINTSKPQLFSNIKYTRNRTYCINQYYSNGLDKSVSHFIQLPLKFEIV